MPVIGDMESEAMTKIKLGSSLPAYLRTSKDEVEDAKKCEYCAYKEICGR
jgi:radical SAM protein with 4Fe4S-binding SPASM domain